MTKPILQRTNNDCGIASLANLFEVSYSDVKALVYEAQDLRGAPFDGTDSDHAAYVGLALDNPIRVWRVGDKGRPAKSSKLLGRRAVLVVPACYYKDELHAVYWDGRRLHDPSGPYTAINPWSYGLRGTKALKVFTEAWVLHADH